MIRKTVEIATPGTRLSVLNGQLSIDRPAMDRVTIPTEDVGVLLVDDHRATYTQSVFTRLLEAGATVVISGPNHMPSGVVLPLDAHHAQTATHRAQAAASLPARKRIWKALVRAKIIQQSRLLRDAKGDDHGIAQMARRVRSGDPENIEAQAAQRYWPKLFGESFRRDREAEGTNALLNYGYIVVRAAAARAITSAGLIPSLGVHHSNRSNPFCLADDLIEPYRPVVDWRVRALIMKHGNAPELSDRRTRAHLLSIFNDTIEVGGRRSSVFIALHRSAASLCRALTSGESTIVVPESLPLEAAPEETEWDIEVR